MARERVPARRRQVQRRLAGIRVGFRAREVKCQHVRVGRRVAAERGLEGTRHRRMQHARARDTERVVDDVLNDRMRELVVVFFGALRLHENPRATQLVQRCQHRFLGKLAHDRQHAEAKSRADHCRDPRDRARVRREMLETLAHGRPHRPRQIELLHFPSQPASATLVEPARLDQRFECLLDEERMSARPRVQPARKLPGGGMIDVERLAHELLDVVLRE